MKRERDKRLFLQDIFESITAIKEYASSISEEEL